MEPLTLAEIEVILHALGEVEWFPGGRHETAVALRQKLDRERERLLFDRLA